ncbi:MAG: twin-arginine translocase TatA/TatE family subunit [Pseudohongiellaceae bacterium]
MGFGGIGPWSLIIILAIVIMIFGTRKLRNMGSDLGSALKGFRSAMRDDESADDAEDEPGAIDDATDTTNSADTTTAARTAATDATSEKAQPEDK